MTAMVLQTSLKQNKSGRLSLPGRDATPHGITTNIYMAFGIWQKMRSRNEYWRGVATHYAKHTTSFLTAAHI